MSQSGAVTTTLSANLAHSLTQNNQKDYFFTYEELKHWKIFDDYWYDCNAAVAKVMSNFDNLDINHLRALVFAVNHGHIQLNYPMNPIELNKLIDLDTKLSEGGDPVLTENYFYKYLNDPSKKFEYNKRIYWLDNSFGMLHQVVRRIHEECSLNVQLFIKQFREAGCKDINWEGYLKNATLDDHTLVQMIEEWVAFTYTGLKDIDGKEEDIIQTVDELCDYKGLEIKVNKWEGYQDINASNLCLEMCIKYWNDLECNTHGLSKVSECTKDNVNSLINILIGSKDLNIKINEQQYIFVVKLLLDIAYALASKKMQSYLDLTQCNCILALLHLTFQNEICIGLDRKIMGECITKLMTLLQDSDKIMILDYILNLYEDIWTNMIKSVDYSGRSLHLIDEMRNNRSICHCFDEYAANVKFFIELLFNLIENVDKKSQVQNQRLTKIVKVIMMLPIKLGDIKDAIFSFHSNLKQSVINIVPNVEQLAGDADELAVVWCDFMWLDIDAYKYLMNLSNSMSSSDRVTIACGMKCVRVFDNQNRIDWSDKPHYATYFETNTGLNWDDN